MGQNVLETLLQSSHCFTNNSEELGRSIKAWGSCDRSSEIRSLLNHAADSVLENRLAAALALLEYAQRKAPSHNLVMLFIGDLRLCLNRADAAEPFEFIARRTDWRGAWIRLAVSHIQARNFAGAAADLNETLSRNAPQIQSEFCHFAAKISKMSSAHGWCGLSNNQIVAIGGSAAHYKVADLTFEIDGRTVALTHRRKKTDDPVQRFDFAEYRSCQSLKVLAKGLPLIGSPISIQSVFRVEGFVEAQGGACNGWCWFPGEPDMLPQVSINSATAVNPKSSITQVASAVEDNDANAQKLMQPRVFSFNDEQISEFDGPVTVSGPGGIRLYGSPLNPQAEAQSNRRAAQTIARCFPTTGIVASCDAGTASLISIPAENVSYRVHAPAQVRERRTLIVIPVFRGFKSTLDCLHSVLKYKTDRENIFVISDGSPDRALTKKLAQLAEAGDFEFHHEQVNKGFTATANLGLRWAAELASDTVLLNSDTLVTSDWVKILRDITYGSDDIGTATPLSNAATIFSYPDVEKLNPIPSLEDCESYARWTSRVNSGVCIDVPTGHGFCLYVRLECLREVGLLREDLFAQGYGEENDFCMRARALGWRNAAAPGSFVGHLESQSFGVAKTSLVTRNLRILNRLHPGYDKLIADWQKVDSLGPSRRKIDVERWSERQQGRDSVLLVTHDRAGGVRRHVDHRATMAEASGRRAIICKPVTGADQRKKCVINDVDQGYPNLVFDIPGELPQLSAFLAICRIKLTELHHFIGHTPETINVLTALTTPYEVHIHDYSWFCPRITLTADKNRYCGEPDLKQCTICTQDHGSNLGYDIEPAALRARSQSILANAKRVIVPSADTHRRIARWFKLDPVISPWETETGPLVLKQIRSLDFGQRRRVCLAGAIGYEKGYDVLLACARLVAEKDLPIDFVVVGFTCDDDRLLRTGRVQITGQYDEAEAVALLRRQNATFGLLPALWPETWSYILTQFWQASLPVVTFDIGTPSSRIRARNGGFVLPFGSSTQQIVDALLTLKTS